MGNLLEVLTTILNQCIDDYGMKLPLIMSLISHNHSLMVMRINEGAEPDILARNYEGGAINIPIHVTVVDQDKAVRVIIDEPDKIGTHH
jgi:hypothetical protein